jgi:hypothetical protein
MTEKNDIMDSILGHKNEEFAGRTRELDCLIYRSDGGVNPEAVSGSDEDSWIISRDNVAVEIWESKAKINVRVSPGTSPNISMKRIASIVVDAILEELKKEG